MLVKGYTVSFPIAYWVLLIPIFLGISYYNIFFDWQLQYYGVTRDFKIHGLLCICQFQIVSLFTFSLIKLGLQCL